MMVFAILLLATTVAAILTREVESGTLLRLKISKMRSFDLLFGGLIPWSLVAGAQVVILLVVAIILGLKWQGSVYSILLAIVIWDHSGYCFNIIGNDNCIILRKMIDKLQISEP